MDRYNDYDYDFADDDYEEDDDDIPDSDSDESDGWKRSRLKKKKQRIANELERSDLKYTRRLRKLLKGKFSMEEVDMPRLAGFIEQRNFPQLQLEAMKALTIIARKDANLIKLETIPAWVNQLDSPKNEVVRKVLSFLEVYTDTSNARIQLLKRGSASASIDMED